MRARTDNIRQACESNKEFFAGSNISGGDVEFQAGKFIPRVLTMAEGITWCQIPKAGTHAWGALFLLLRGLGVQQIKVKSYICSIFLSVQATLVHFSIMQEYLCSIFCPRFFITLSGIMLVMSGMIF